MKESVYTAYEDLPLFLNDAARSTRYGGAPTADC